MERTAEFFLEAAKVLREDADQMEPIAGDTVKDPCDTLRIQAGMLEERAKEISGVEIPVLWVIDDDFIAEGDEKSCRGRRSHDFAITRVSTTFPVASTTGPFNGAVMDKRFVMLDDDGRIYYTGWCSEESLAPLEDFGQPNAGCTEIRYRNDQGKFVRL